MASSIQLLRSTISQERPFPGNLLEGQPAVNLNSSEPGLFFKAADGSLVKIGPAAITSDGLPPNSAPAGSSGNTAGELWLDKSVNPPVLKVYDGTAWINAGSGGGGGGGNVTLLRWTKTAIGGETSLSGADDSGLQLTYTPGLEQIFLNGVLLERGEDYIGTNGTAFSNFAPLSAGDIVIILSYSPMDVGVLDADFITYTQSGTGADQRTVGNRLRDFVSVKDFGAAGNGIDNDTNAINEAILAAEALGNATVYFPAGRYLVGDTINLRPGTKIQGANGDMGGVAGATSFPDQLSDSKGTVILFKPNVQKSLFVPSLPKGGSAAWSAISIKGLNIWGNSTMDAYHRAIYGETSDITTSLYAIDFREVQYSNVEDVAIMGFVAGVRCGERCQHNRFTSVHIERCRTSLLYTSLQFNVEPTSDVWLNCSFRVAKHMIEAENNSILAYDGSSLQQRFHSCYFEDCSSHAFKIPRGAREWGFFDCYGEALCIDPSETDASCFYIGHDGLPGSAYNLPSVTVVGGQYSSFLTAPNTSFINTDLVWGASFIAVTAKRFNIGIKCTADTRDDGLYLSNPTFNSVSTLFDTSSDGKIIGQYRTVDSSSSTNVSVLRSKFLTSSSSLQLTGTTITLGDSSTSQILPGGIDGTKPLGASNRRWGEVYSERLLLTRNSGDLGVLTRTGSDGDIFEIKKGNVKVGSISVTATNAGFNDLSDYRLKDNIKDLSNSGEFIDALKPRTWTWSINGETGNGFVAHELNLVSPSSVTGEKDQVDQSGDPVYQGVCYSSAELIANMVAEIKDLRRRLAEANI